MKLIRTKSSTKPRTARERLLKKMGIDHRAPTYVPQKGAQPLLKDRKMGGSNSSVDVPRSTSSRRSRGKVQEIDYLPVPPVQQKPPKEVVSKGRDVSEENVETETVGAEKENGNGEEGNAENGVSGFEGLKEENGLGREAVELFGGIEGMEGTLF